MEKKKNYIKIASQDRQWIEASNYCRYTESYFHQCPTLSLVNLKTHRFRITNTKEDELIFVF